MEDTLVAAYTALLTGYCIMEDEVSIQSETEMCLERESVSSNIYGYCEYFYVYIMYMYFIGCLCDVNDRYAYLKAILSFERMEFSPLLFFCRSVRLRSVACYLKPTLT